MHRFPKTKLLSQFVRDISRLLCQFIFGLVKIFRVKQQGKAEGNVKVYILLGQSNMLGMGHVHGDKDGSLEYAVQKKKLYPYLVDDQGHWMTSDRVRNVRVMDGRDGKMHVFHNVSFYRGCSRTSTFLH